MRVLRTIGILILILIVAYFIGPKPFQPKFSNALIYLPSNPPELEKYIADRETLHKLKPGNEAKIVWYNDSLKNKTEYAVVYLHGFSASREEGNPVHIDFAKKFCCNLFLSRLASHGIDTSEPMMNLTAEQLWASAKEAYEVGRKLGKKIILMSTSTGGTLALKLASSFPDIAALILLSPNISINDKNAWILNNPWGLQIAKLLRGNYIIAKDTSTVYQKYWYTKYRIESVAELEELLESSMKESVFKKVNQPVLMLYYYKDEDHQDPVVKVSAMKRMFAQLGTPKTQKRAIAIPKAGEHVLGSYIKSKDLKTVEYEMEKFGKEVLMLKER